MSAPQTRHHFQKEDDEKLIELVNSIGKNWKKIHSELPSWTERQLRDRYSNYLQPGINNSEWTPWEDGMLLTKVNQIGHKWSRLTSFFSNRSAVNIKNRYSFLTGSGARQMRKKRHQEKMLSSSEKPTFQSPETSKQFFSDEYMLNQFPFTDLDELCIENPAKFDFDININPSFDFHFKEE